MNTYSAILIAAIVRMAIGAFWFSPAGFGKQWMHLSGVTKDKMTEAQKKGMWKLYATEFIASLATAFVLAVILGSGYNTPISGAVAGAIFWIGLTAAWNVSEVIWGNKPMKLFWITGGFQLVSMIVMGAIVAAWA